MKAMVLQLTESMQQKTDFAVESDAEIRLIKTLYECTQWMWACASGSSFSSQLVFNSIYNCIGFAL